MCVMDFWLRKFLEKSVPESKPEDAERDRQDHELGCEVENESQCKQDQNNGDNQLEQRPEVGPRTCSRRHENQTGTAVQISRHKSTIRSEIQVTCGDSGCNMQEEGPGSQMYGDQELGEFQRNSKDDLPAISSTSLGIWFSRLGTMDLKHKD